MPAASPEHLVRGIRNDPVGWIAQTFGDELVGKQTEIVKAVLSPDVHTVYVPSCHDSGKSFSASRILLTFLAAYPNDSIVISTAPTWAQVENILWREVASAYHKSVLPFGGELLGTQLKLGPKWFAIGLSTNQPVNLQGYHASNVLVIIDEADGVPTDIWTALDGVLTNANATLLAIGNPLDPQSEFKRRHDLAGAGERVIRISADDVIPLTDTGRYPFLLQRAWVDDKKRKWGETSALYAGKVLARWPDQGTDVLIPVSWLERAKGRAVPKGLRSYGVDVARYGTARTVRTLLEGGWCVFSKATSLESTVQTAGRVMADIRQYEPAAVAVDDTGLGGGVTDQLIAGGFRVLPVNNGSVAWEPERFVNRGAEMWWSTREAFEADRIGFDMSDPEAVDELIADLNRPKYEIVGQGKIAVDKYGIGRGRTNRGMSDEERGAKSPDRGDSFALAHSAIRYSSNARPKTEIEKHIERDLRRFSGAATNPWLT